MLKNLMSSIFKKTISEEVFLPSCFRLDPNFEIESVSNLPDKKISTLIKSGYFLHVDEIVRSVNSFVFPSDSKKLYVKDIFHSSDMRNFFKGYDSISSLTFPSVSSNGHYDSFNVKNKGDFGSSFDSINSFCSELNLGSFNFYALKLDSFGGINLFDSSYVLFDSGYLKITPRDKYSFKVLDTDLVKQGPDFSFKDEPLNMIFAKYIL